MPAPTLDPATAAQMTPEQIADFNSQVTPEPAPQTTVNLDEDAFSKMDYGQVEDFKKNFPPDTKINIGKSAKPKGERPVDLDPETFKRMTPEQLADFSRQTKFSPYTWAQLHRDQLDDDTLQKLGQADVVSRKQGFTFSDIPWESVKDAIPSLVKGLYQYGKLAVKNAPVSGGPFSQIMQAATGKHEETPAETKSLAEQTAATEAAATGLGDLARRTFNKTGRFFHLQKPLDQYTPEDAKELFKNELAIRDQLGEVFAGKGDLTTKAGGPELKRLQAAGVQLNPETISEASAGDPLSFAAFSGGFKLFNAATGKVLGYAATRSSALQTLAKLKAIRGVVSRAEATAAEMPTEANISAANRAVIAQGAERAAAGGIVSGLEQAQIAGEKVGQFVSEAPAVAIGRTIQGAGKTIGAIPAIEKRIGNLGIVAELARGDIPGALSIFAARAVKPVLEKTAGALEGFGKAIAERNAPGGTWARAVEDLSKVPGTAIGGAAKGFPMDLGLMAVSSETPEEQRESPFMATALGAAHALLLGGKGFVTGQTLAPRPWAPSNSWNKSYGNFPALDAIHADTMKIAGEGVKQRLGALRDLADTTGTEVFQFSGEDQLAKFFESQGRSPEEAASLARNNGMIIAKMADKSGTARQVILLRDPASAPHEVSHSIEDALTQDQQTQYYNDLEKAYGTDNVLKQAEDEARAQISTQDEADEADLNWKNFLLRKTGDGPAAAAEKAKTDPSLAGKPWDTALTEDEKTELVKLYALKEIGADAMAAALKHSGAAPTLDSPVLRVAARTIGHLMTFLGADPYAGITEGTRGMEVKPEAVAAAEKLAQPFLVEARAKKGGEKPTVTPEAAPRTPKGPAAPPVTPEERTAAADTIRAEATVASDVKPPAPGAQSPREILGTMADAAESGTAVRSKYFGAKGEETTADPDAKREERRQEIEAARNLPNDVRQLFDRIGFPYGLERTKSGNLQVLDWSPELLASNAFRWAKALSQLPENHPALADLPFQLDRANGEFTNIGWRQLFDAAEKFSKNQLAGFTGAGKELVVPSELAKEGLFKPAQTGTPEALDQNVADFINMLYSLRPPKTPRAGKGTPRNITAQVVSAATEPGRVVKPSLLPSGAERQPFAEPKYGISTIGETNPLRAKLETALQENKIPLPDTVEVVRRLNLDRIHSVEPEPVQPKTAGGNVLTLQAGFQGPKREIEIVGPNGDKYKALFDGYQDATVLGMGFIPQITPLEDIPGIVPDRSTTYSTTLEKAGFKLPEGIKTEESQPGPTLDEIMKFQGPAAIDNPRAVEKAAVRDAEGKIYTGSWHGEAYMNAVTENAGKVLGELEDGFVTKEGEFLDRAQALQRAQEIKQVGEYRTYHQGSLESGEFEKNRRFQAPEKNDIQDLAKSYAEKEGLPYRPLSGMIPVREDLAKRLADFYQAEQHNPDDPAVKASYDALGEETVKQYHAIQDAGYTIEPWKGKGEPYSSSADMVKDVKENKHLWFLPTDRNFSGEENNLMLRPSGVDDLSYNDVFRAVHDFFGHAKEGYQFGPKGELNAWNAHSRMYSDEAQGALAAETLAQNSWVNFGEHLRGETGNIPKKGEPGFVPQPERPFAEQKNMVVPESFRNEAQGKTAFQAKQRERDPLKFAPAGKNIFEGSKAWILPNGKVEQLGGQWHHDWLDQNKEVQKKYGLKIPPFEGGDSEGVREQALQKGFSRVNLVNGSLTVEARQRDWRNIRPIVEDIVEKNLDDIDKLRIFLFDDKVDKLVKSNSGNIFDADTDAEKSQRALDIINGGQAEVGGVKFQGIEERDRERAVNLGYNDESDEFQWEDKNGNFVGPGFQHEQPAKDWKAGEPFGKHYESKRYPEQGGVKFQAPEQSDFEDQPQTELGRTAFQPGVKGVIGSINPYDLEIDAKSMDLSKGSHAAVKFLGHQWRYNPETQTVYWWHGPPDEKIKDAVTDWLDRKGYKVKKNVDISSTNDRYDAAHGETSFQAPEQSDFESPDTLPEALSKPGWAILTGTREKIEGQEVPWDDPRNLAANAKLKAELKSKSYDTITVEGKYKGEPQGENYMVLGITPDEAKALGKKYLQESIITNKGLLYGDGSITPAVPSKTTIGLEAEKQPFYSVLPNGTAFSIGLDFETPYKPVGEQQELFGKTASEAQEFARRLKSRIADKKEKFPESAPLGYVKDAEGNFKIDAKTGKPVPEKQDYTFLESGMAKEAGKGLRGADREEAYVKAAGDAMAKEYRQAVKDPEVAAGAKWYSTLRTRLRKLFGDQSQLVCEILAATSARTPVETNYKFGIDALNKFNAGDYDAQIAKYQEGLDKWDKGDIADYVAATNLSNPKRATFLDWWIKTHNLKPRQSNGKLFAANSKAVLRALHGSWEGGKKTRQFSQNMSGADFGSTIDVWAARTLHRISNEGRVDRWRILPEHENAVQDDDFDVAQKVFKYAADKVGVKPDAMQGTLWFREKDLWEKRGWTRGAGAEKSDFSSLIAETEKTPEGKFKLKTPQLELMVEPRQQR